MYVAFANHGFNPPYHGWILAYNASTLHQDWAFNTTCNAQSGGVWMGGDGIAADSGGNLFFSTGNGTFDQNSGGGDYGDTLLKLSPSGGTSATTSLRTTTRHSTTATSTSLPAA